MGADGASFEGGVGRVLLISVAGLGGWWIFIDGGRVCVGDWFDRIVPSMGGDLLVWRYRSSV